jgi:hypothetical protein
MDRVEVTATGVALVGHGALLLALSLGLAVAVRPPAMPDAMEVSFVDEVAMTASAPQPSTAPAPAASTPEPAPPQFNALTSQPTPAPSPDRSAARPKPARPAPRPIGLHDLDIPGADPSARPSPGPPARMTGQAAADIASAISRQVQPCANRQVYPGPGSERILTPIILSLNRDGSLKGRPRVGEQTGIDAENSRYAQRVADLAVNAFVSCAPLRGLPAELYDVPRGWASFTMRYRLPG